MRREESMPEWSDIRKQFPVTERSVYLNTAAAGPLAFVRSLVFKGGFRDGFAGLSIATFAAYHDFLKHLMLWELQNGKERR